jgi:uncharacterized phiE125 gp8 family phage protein
MYLDPNTNIQGDLVLTVDATVDVVSVAEIKSHLRIDTSDEDTLLGLYIDSATEMAENYCGRHFITHEYKLYFNEVVQKASLIFPDCTLVTQSGQNDHRSVWYINASGTEIGSDNAFIDAYSNPSIAYLSSDFTNTTLKDNAANVFWFNFKTGFGDAATNVPQAIKQAIKLIVSDMYYFREDRKRSFPMASEILLQPYKCYH